MRTFLQNYSAQADYGWFAVATLWAVAGWLWWRGRQGRAPNPGWIPWVAAGGLATAGLEIFFSSLTYVDVQEPRVVRAAVLGAVSGLSAVGFGWSLAAGRKRQVLVGALVVIYGLGVGLRLGESSVPCWVEAVVVSVLAAAWVRRAGSAEALSRREKSLVVPAVGVPWLSVVGTVGPLAMWTAEEVRWVEGSMWAWPAVWAHWLVGAGVVVGLARALFDDPVRRRFVALTAVALAAWLAVGFLLAGAATQFARNTFRGSATTRAQTAALLLDGDYLARLAGPELRFTERIKNTTPEGWTSEIWISSRLQASDTQPTREQLRKILQANPDVRYVDFSIVREGWLLAVLFPTGAPGEGNEGARQRPLTAAHHLSWATGEPVFEGPFRNPWGTMVHALAPVRTSAGRTVGWVVLQWGSTQWAASQLHARLLAFGVLAAGVVIGLLGLGRRLAALEREAALQRVAVATAEMSAQTAFLAKVSHELRTPLQGILGGAKLLLETAEDAATTRRLRLLNGEAEHLQRLVDDLLDLSALEAGGFRLVEQPHDLRRVVADTVETFQARAARRGLTLQQTFSGDGNGWVVVDVMRLRQVLLNLISNAVKFTSTGGVEVALHLHHAPEGVRVDLAVSDTGPGLSATEIETLFRPFTRLPGSGQEEGMGLGLALSAALCRRMGGSLSATSDGRSGSVFRVNLLLRAASGRGGGFGGPAAALSRVTDEPVQVRGRVLVVDDHPAVRELYGDWLVTAGAFCISATNADEARRALQAHPVDAIVLDLSLGRADGCALAAEWRQAEPAGGPRRRIIGVSAHAAAAERERALRSGMDVFLLKPVARHDLFGALNLPGAAAAGDELPEALRRRFYSQLDADWRRLRTDIREAIEAGDWPRVGADAHYLKNSADVLALGRLQLNCARLEQASSAGDAARVAAVFAEMADIFAQLETAGLNPKPTDR